MSEKLKTIALVPNILKDPELKAASVIAGIAAECGVVPLVSAELSGKVEHARAASHFQMSEADMIVTLGGDGTLLSAVHEFENTKSAFLGINHGNLGFLTEIEKNSLKEFREILNGGYTTASHLTINTQLGCDTYTALNDATIHRDAMASMIKFRVSINGELLYTICADGIIISTPTGSTAYSLSAGGPIVDPTVDVIILTLICPHDLNTRSILVPGSMKITVEILEASAKAAVNFDGCRAVTVKSGDVLNVTSGDKIKLVRTCESSFYKRLKEKLF